MAKLKINFQPLFLIYVFVCIYFGWFNSIFYYVVAVVLHEMGHYFVCKYFGYNVDGIVFRLYGAGLKSNNAYKSKDDVVISLAGPLVNLILIVLIICLWWLFPTIYFFTYEFLICNIVVMLFNLLPIYPLDGGRVVFALLSKKVNARKKLIKFNFWLCFIVGIVFLIIFFMSIFYHVNYNLLFIGLFMCFNGIVPDNTKYYDMVKVYNKKYSKPVEVKTFKVNNLDKSTLIKYLSPHYYSIFEYCENNKKTIISESELLE